MAVFRELGAGGGCGGRRGCRPRARDSPVPRLMLGPLRDVFRRSLES